MRQRRSLLISMVMLAVLAVPAIAAEPAQLRLTTQARPDGAMRLTATVTDAAGAPVAGIPVTLRGKTTFGWLTLGDKETDRQGRVQVILPPSARFEEIAAEAGDQGTLQAAIRLERLGPAEPAVRPNRDVLSRLSPQPGFISPYPQPMQVLFLGLVLGGIWATYAYLISLLLKIRRGAKT